MDDFYPAERPIIYVIFSIAEFDADLKVTPMPYARQDSDNMRRAFDILEIEEYKDGDTAMSRKQRIEKAEAVKLIHNLSESQELKDCSMVIFVISTHGGFDYGDAHPIKEQQGQTICFSDQEMRLFDLLKPIQSKMSERPVLVIGDFCRGHYNKLYTRIGTMPTANVPQPTVRLDWGLNRNYMAETYIFYACLIGHTSPVRSPFLGMLAGQMALHGKVQTFNFITRQVKSHIMMTGKVSPNCSDNCHRQLILHKDAYKTQLDRIYPN